MDKWIDIKEEFPPPSTGILVTDGKIVTVCELYKEVGPRGLYLVMNGHEFGGYEWEFDIEPASITHWMYLPSPP